MDTMDDLIDMMDFDFGLDLDSDFDCSYTDRNRHVCSGFHSNPSYMNIESAHLIQSSHFVIKST